MRLIKIILIVLLIPIGAYLGEVAYQRRNLLEDIANLWQNLRRRWRRRR